jgi:ADP-heptose:LPS heptosyltransferase
VTVKHKKYLIVRPDRIGDVVLSTPIPREIKRSNPANYVAVMVTEYTKDLYLNNPCVDEIITFPKQDERISPTEYFSYLSLLRSYKFDYAFMLLPNERINYLLFLAGIRMRIGVGHKFFQFITNTKSVYRRKYNPLRHESDYCLDMLRKTGIEPSSINPEIYLTDEEKKKALELKKEMSPEGKLLIGINSTSGNSAPNITFSEYRKLIDLLLSFNEYKVVVTDYNPPSEIGSIESVFYPCKGKPLRESIVSISTLDLLISASTGPMHIASALAVPTISLFCPLTACSPVLWGPLGNRSRIILPEEGYCSYKCPGDPKKCNFSGEGGINSRKIFEQIKIFTGNA